MQVGATSDLILTLAGEDAAFTPTGKRLARAALEGCDRSWAEAIAQRHRHAAPHARLRKWSVWRLAQRVAAESPLTAQQLVVLGAGWSPLGVDWCSHHSDARVLEVDLALADAKRRLVGRIAPECATRWRSLTADAADAPALQGALLAAGWNPAAPTCWVAEGLLYYIPPRAADDLARWTLTSHSESRLIVECGLPYDSIEPGAGVECRAYHDEIARHIGHAELQVSSPDHLARVAGARVLSVLDPATAERLRGDSHPCFSSPLDSTQRVALLAPADGRASH